MKRQRGFTLVEMMVVVGIIGILVTMAIVYTSPRVRAVDGANRVGELVREASRRAVSLGPVRTDVALNVTSKKARTRIVGSGSSTALVFTLQRLQEHAIGDSGADWYDISSYTLNKAVLGQYWANNVGSYTTLSGGASATWTSFAVYCYPNGTCDAKTLFFEAVRTSGLDYRARLSVMPLGGATYVRPDWN